MAGQQFAQQCAGQWHSEKAAFSAGERHRCPYHLPLMAVQHLRVPQPGDYGSFPLRGETSSHFPQGALTAKWIETFPELFRFDLKVSAEAKK